MDQHYDFPYYAWGKRRYNSISEHLKSMYGRKLYKLSLQSGCTCPNRDGKISTGGCIFCSEAGSGDFAADAELSISDQISEAKKLVIDKLPELDLSVPNFIAYFQSYTNTYGPIEKLRAIFTEAINHPDIAILSIATRPDCLGPEVLDLLKELNKIKPVWIELGLQTVSEQSAELINRGYELPVFEEAVYRLNSIGIQVIVHVILGLPYETPEMMLETIDYCNSLPIRGIKLQLLHILENTPLHDMYLHSYAIRHHLALMELEDYLYVLELCVERLSPDIIIHRLTGDGPKSLLVAPTWSADKKMVLNTFHQMMAANNSWQGKSFE